MKKALLAVALLALAGQAWAGSHYFRLMDTNHLQMGAEFHVAPKNLSTTSGMTGLAIVTHSDADGSLCTKFNLGAWCVPEAWTPLQISLGGSFTGDAYGGVGTSANLSPVFAALFFSSKVGGAAGAVRDALNGSKAYQVRLGGSLDGQLIHGGTFSSAKEAYPGRGLWNVIGNAGRVVGGMGWKF